MGIQIEFNPDLALRHISHYKNGQRQLEECIPEYLEVGMIYFFLKEGQRNYWLEGELPLLQTEGNCELSRPVASIVILEAIHFRKGDKNYTRGKYQVKAVFNQNSSQINFEGFNRI